MYAFKVTDGINRDLARFEELRAAFDVATPLPRSWSGRMRRDLESAAIGASVSMEGVPVTVDEVRRILAGDRPADVSEGDAELVQGYREAMRLVLARADDPNFAWHAELLRAIHDRVLAGSWAAGAGRYREGQNYVVDRATRRQLYLPPPPEHVPGLVDEFASWLGSREAELSPLVAAAVAHAGLAGIHPFRDGNGRTARILASLIMCRGGYKRSEFTSLEEWWGSHLTDYYSAFVCLGEKWDPGADVTPFVESHVRAQVSQAEALSLRHATERLLWVAAEDVAMHVAHADPRAANALYDAAFGRSVTNRYYRGVVDVTPPTAATDLARLEAAGLIQKRGAGRSTAYLGTPRLAQEVARATGATLDVAGAQVLDESLRDELAAALATRTRGS